MLILMADSYNRKVVHPGNPGW